MEDLKQRLIDFARYAHGMGQNKFEDFCGIANGTINAIKGKGPSATTLAKIAEACPELNLRWLLLGIGEMTSKVFNTELQESKDIIYKLSIENYRLQKELDSVKRNAAN